MIVARASFARRRSKVDLPVPGGPMRNSKRGAATVGKEVMAAHGATAAVGKGGLMNTRDAAAD